LEKTEPVVNYYSEEKGNLIEVDGSGEINSVTTQIVDHLEKAKHG
jgi:adenylate kinase